jgi:CRISPR-associated protein Cmr3
MSASWTGFRLLPDDVLFFRDGKPASRGADHYLRSIFPPHPSTLYGALRTRRLVDEGISLRGLNEARWRGLRQELRDELGEWGGFGSLEVRGPWLVRHGEVLLPAPRDLLVTVAAGRADDDGGGPAAADDAGNGHRNRRVERVARLLPPPEPAPGGASHALAPLLAYEWREGGWTEWAVSPQAREPRPAEGWFLRPAGCAAWRRGGVPEPADFVHADELWGIESRVGLGLEAAERRGEEGQLYTFGYVRLQPGVAIGFEARHTGLKREGQVVLGADGRTSTLAAGPGLDDLLSDEPIGSARFRLILATPALSRSGSALPAANADGDGEPARVLSAVVSGWQLLGGWDVAAGRSKPLRRALPAGSVFLLDAGTGAAARLDGRNLSDYETEALARQGFGLALTGRDPHSAD